jgi:hypothetical protein
MKITIIMKRVMMIRKNLLTNKIFNIKIMLNQKVIKIKKQKGLIL